ncbi:methyltransferase [Mycoplasmatota bacterium WC30]
MSHYYSKDNDNLESLEKDIFFKIKDKSFHLITDNGVFSKSGLDFGSRLLIETVIEISKSKVLDLGSGYGPIGIVYKVFNPKSTITLSDINSRAVNLSTKNVKLNNLVATIINSNGFNKIDQKYDMILTNPPIRIGKEKVYQLFSKAYEYLEESGVLVFVMNKKQGAASAIKFCEGIYPQVEVINKKSGFLIIKCIK